MQMLLCYKYRMQRNRHRIMQIDRATHIFWVREILRRREEKGAYLVRELQLDAENHHQLAYFRMLINLLTATAQNEIKETILDILYLYDDLVIPQLPVNDFVFCNPRYRTKVDTAVYMMILLYCSI